MKKALIVDCCVRGKASRTRILLERFLSRLPALYEREILDPEAEGVRCFNASVLAERDELLQQGRTDHPRFRYARQLAEADLIVIAAPFWDLSFPAILKIWIENVSVDGITFAANETGLKGLCRAKDLVFLTTRGGIYTDDPMEMGSRYLEALQHFFGIGAYHCIAADGLDTDPARTGETLEEAAARAEKLAETL